MRTTICALAIITAASLPALAGDITMTSKVTTADGKTTTALAYFSKDHVRMAHGDGKESLVDSSGQMTTIDTKKKTYYITTREDMDRLMVMMQARMKSQSAGDRKATNAAMQGMFDVNVQKTGATRKIAGYGCEVWTLSVGQVSSTEECLTNELPFPAQIWDMYRKYSEGMRNMMASMGPMAKSAAKMKEMKGYPLSTRTTLEIMGHKTVVGTEVTDIRGGSIPSSAWEIPAGYTKIDNPMLKAFSRMKS